MKNVVWKFCLFFLSKVSIKISSHDLPLLLRNDCTAWWKCFEKLLCAYSSVIIIIAIEIVVLAPSQRENALAVSEASDIIEALLCFMSAHEGPFLLIYSVLLIFLRQWIFMLLCFTIKITEFIAIPFQLILIILILNSYQVFFSLALSIFTAVSTIYSLLSVAVILLLTNRMCAHFCFPNKNFLICTFPNVLLMGEFIWISLTIILKFSKKKKKNYSFNNYFNPPYTTKLNVIDDYIGSKNVSESNFNVSVMIKLSYFPSKVKQKLITLLSKNHHFIHKRDSLCFNARVYHTRDIVWQFACLGLLEPWNDLNLLIIINKPN